MNFKIWLENYKDINNQEENEKVNKLNMTASLPFEPKTIPQTISDIGKLTRGFHLNTIVGRMMTPWINSLKYAPIDYELLETDPEKARKWSVSSTDRKANNNYKAAYDLFKQEIANAVDALPVKLGNNIITGKPEDVLLKTKEFLSNYTSEEKDLIESLNNAWNLYTKVFGNDPKSNFSQIQNFANFFQLVKEEFMKIGELLNNMQDDDGLNLIQNDFFKALNKEQRKYEKMMGVSFK
jgi:hypothetical protein